MLFTAILPDGLNLYNEYKLALKNQEGAGPFIQNLRETNKISEKTYYLLAKHYLNKKLCEKSE